LVVTPFLPGDSLLFAAGTLAAMGSLSLPLLITLLFTAAVLGDTLNYAVGAPRRLAPRSWRRARWTPTTAACADLACGWRRAGNWLGAKAFTQHSSIFKKEYLDKTEAFFAKYGAKTARSCCAARHTQTPPLRPACHRAAERNRRCRCRAPPRRAADCDGALRAHRAHVRAVRGWRWLHDVRNLPLLQRGTHARRRCAPAAQRLRHPPRWQAGAALWTVSFSAAGFFFGGLPFVQKNFTLVVLAIILVSVLPVAYEARPPRLPCGLRARLRPVADAKPAASLACRSTRRARARTRKRAAGAVVSTI
jgi:membrane protein DedA with SNARE-associated domain